MCGMIAYGFNGKLGDRKLALVVQANLAIWNSAIHIRNQLWTLRLCDSQPSTLDALGELGKLHHHQQYT